MATVQELDLSVMKNVDFKTRLPDIDKDFSVILNRWFEQFIKLYALSEESSISHNCLFCFLAGPRVANPYDGIEPYNDLPDITSLFIALASKNPDISVREKRYKTVYEKINSLLPYCEYSDPIYHLLIKAIDAYKPEYVDTDALLNIIGKTGYYSYGSAGKPNMQVFTEYVNVSSIGQLLNHDIAKTVKSEIVYSEILKGLRDDKITGIPSCEIVSFFAEQPDRLIVKNFDIDMLILNIYNSLYKAGNLEEYAEQQTKNINFNAGLLSQNKNAMPPDSVPGGGIPNEITLDSVRHKLTGHYENLRIILDRLINLKDDLACRLPAIDVCTLAHMIVNVPGKNFFLYPSYINACNLLYDIMDIAESEAADYIAEQKSLSLKGYLGVFKKIITMNPNIDIPLNIMKRLFQTDDEKACIYHGLELGLIRYSFFAIKRFEKIIYDQYGIGFYDPENKESINGNTKFLGMSFKDQLSYVFNEAETAYEQVGKECREINNAGEGEHSCASCEYANRKTLSDGAGGTSAVNSYHCMLTDRPEYALRDSVFYNEIDLKGVFERANDYLQRFLS